MTLHTHLIEHRDMDTEGLSARTEALVRHLSTDRTFSDAKSLKTALSAAESNLSSKPNDRHMVVICAHGVEGTGTWLDMGRGDPPYPMLEKMFSAVPPQTLVYMAVCWGGYTAAVDRVQHGMTPCPVVVGPLVPLTADEGDGLQDLLIGHLEQSFDEERLVAFISDFNANRFSNYGQQAVRIARTDRTLLPKQGAAGTSWSLLRDDADSPHEGPFQVTAVVSRTVTVTDGHRQWSVDAGWLQVAKKSAIRIGDRFRFKAKENPEKTTLLVIPPVHVA